MRERRYRAYFVRPGHTYAISTEPYDGWVKIGRTNPGVNPNTRLAACQTGNARELRLRATWLVDAERDLHAVYAEFRGNGEWFALPRKFVQDMARFAIREDPWEHLFETWPTSRIWELAEPHLKRSKTPETLARVFMTVGAAELRGDTKLRSDRRDFCWRPSERDRRLLATGAPLTITVVGEVIDCAASAPVIGLVPSPSLPGGDAR